MFFYKNHKAFTLSELLITLGIIGVVAAMTIPTLVNDVSNQELYTRFKKINAELPNITKLVMFEKGKMEERFDASSSHDDVMNFFSDKLNVVKSCPEGSSWGNCWHASVSDFHTLHGGDYWGSSSELPAVILNDGSLITFYNSKVACVNNQGTSPFDKVCGWLLVDTNGFEEPNTAGYDIYNYALTPKGLFVAGSSTHSLFSDHSVYCDLNSTDTHNGMSCGARILQEGGINY